MTDPKRFYSDTLDAAAKNRANHTGTQAIGTIDGLTAVLMDTATAAQGALADAALPKTGGAMTGAIAFAAGQTWPTFNQSTTGSAAKWTTARTLTIGDKGYALDGSANVTWTLADIGAAADGAVLKLTGAQTVAGVKTFTSRSAHAGAYTPSLTPAHSATPTFDCSLGNVFEPGLVTSNITSITMSNPVAGQAVNIVFKQDATGGRTIAVPSGAKIDGAPNTAANRISVLVMQYYGAGSVWIGNWLVVPA